jgi:hypothetical protein
MIHVLRPDSFKYSNFAIISGYEAVRRSIDELLRLIEIAISMIFAFPSGLAVAKHFVYPCGLIFDLHRLIIPISRPIPVECIQKL